MIINFVPIMIASIYPQYISISKSTIHLYIYRTHIRREMKKEIKQNGRKKNKQKSKIVLLLYTHALHYIAIIYEHIIILQ